MKPVSRVVLIDGKSPLTEGGGFQTYTANLGRTLKELGYTVHIFCFGNKNEVANSKFGLIHTVKSWLYDLPILRTVELAALPFLAPILTKAIIRQLEANQPTIFWGIGPWSLVGALVKRLWTNKNKVLIAYYPVTFRHEFDGTNAAINVEDYGFLEKLKVVIVWRVIIPIYSQLERFSIYNCDYIVNHYRSAEAILRSQFGVDPARFIRFPYSLRFIPRRADKSKESPISLNKPLVILICRHDGRKGINYLLHAFAILNQKRVSYQAVLIGGGKLLSAHRKLAQRLGLGNVLFPGFVADPRIYLQKTDVYVLPSVEEGSSSISLLEAMEFGLPIIATAIDGIPEDVTNGKSALLVPPYDSVGLAQAMELLLKNRRLAGSLAKEAKRRFSKDHSPNEMKKKLKEFLQKIDREIAS